MSSRSSTPTNGRMSIDVLVGASLTLLAFVIYVITLCPTIFTDDCGEIATAVATFGVMHPTGYPLYSIIGGLLIRAIPWGEPAWRLGFLSAIPAALTVGVVYAILRRLRSSIAWSIAGALTLAFSYNLWSQATKVETYALNAFFVALVVYFALTFHLTAECRWLISTCLTAGFAATNHLNSLWVLPGVAILLIGNLRRLTKPVAWAAIGIVAFLLPLNLYWYDMYVAIHRPHAQVWGDPSTFRALVDHVSGAKFHGNFGYLPQDQAMSAFFSFAPAWMWTNIGPLVILAPFGIARAWRTDRLVSLMLITSILGYLVLEINYHIGNIYEYYTPLIILLVVAGAMGGDAVTSYMMARKPLNYATKQVVASFIIMCSIIPVAMRWSVCNRSHDRFVERYGENLLSEVPDRGVLVVDSDVSLYSAWYAQQVLGIRRDVVVLSRGLLHSAEADNRLNAWYFRKIDQQDPSLGMLDKLRRSADDDHYAVTERPLWDTVADCVVRNRPVYFVETSPADLTQYNGNMVLQAVHPPCVLQQEGILNHVVRIEGQLSAEKRIAQNVNTITRLEIDPTSDDIRSLETSSPSLWLIYGEAFAGVARDLLQEHRWADSIKWSTLAIHEMPQSADALDLYATSAINLGQKQAAIDSWRKATAFDPHNPNYQAKLNLALTQ